MDIEEAPWLGTRWLKGDRRGGEGDSEGVDTERWCLLL